MSFFQKQETNTLLELPESELEPETLILANGIYLNSMDLCLSGGRCRYLITLHLGLKVFQGVLCSNVIQKK